MNLEQFEAEAEKLARKGIILRTFGEGKPIAYWHGFENENICISVSIDDYWLNVYVDEQEGGHVEKTSEPMISNIPLYGSPFTSFPPVDGIFLKGSEAIGDFLEYYDWPRAEPYNENFPNPIPEEYDNLWQENNPMYQSDITAVIGGWPIIWTDNDLAEFVDQKLIVWTIEDAEPWVEVFLNENEYTVKQRIT